MPHPIPGNHFFLPDHDTAEAAASSQRSSIRSPEERVAEVFSRIAHPDLGKYLQAAQGGTTSKMNAVEQFQRSADFRPFSNEMRHCLKALQAGCYSGAYCNSYDHLVDRLELQTPNAGKTHYGSAVFDMYSFACLYFKQILALLNQARNFPVTVPLNALELAKPLIKNLEDELLVCAPGLLQKTEDTLNTLKHALFPPGLLQHINHTRYQIAQQHLGQRLGELFKDDPHLEGNHIHMVKAWMNQVAPSLNISFTAHDDQYASKAAYYDIVSYPKQLDILAELQKLTSYPNAIERIVEDTLQEARDRLSELKTDERNNYGLANELIMKPLQSRFGNLPASAIFSEGTENPGKFFIHDNPSLFIAELRLKIKDQSETRSNRHVETEKFSLDKDGRCMIHKWGSAVWVERKTGSFLERDLLQLNDFTEERAVALMQEINWLGSSPDRLLYEPFVNHPAFGKLFRKLLALHKPEPIIVAAAAWCSLSDNVEAQILRCALNNAAQKMRFNSSNLFEASSLLDLSDQQMDVALKNLSQHGPFGDIPTILSWFLLCEYSGPIDDRVFKFIVKDTPTNNRFLQESIMQAIAGNQVPRLKLLIESTHQSNEQRSTLAQSLLTRHYQNVSEPMTDYLLSLKPQLDGALNETGNLLELYINEASDPVSKLVAKAWIQSGQGDFHDRHGLNMVCLAASKLKSQTLHSLIQCNEFNLNAKDNQGRSALHCALNAAVENTEIDQQQLINVCALLIKGGIETNSVDLAGNDAFSHAIKSQAHDETVDKIIRLLIDCGAADRRDSQDLDAFGKACLHGKPTVAGILLNRPGFVPDDLAFHHLCSVPADREIEDSRLNGVIKIRKFTIYKMLLQRGLKPDKLDADGRTPIELALLSNQWNLAVNALRIRPNIDRLEPNGYNMLHKAVISGNTKLAEALVVAGANINARSGRAHAGKTALHLAIKQGNELMYKRLVELRANTKIRDFKLRSATDYQRARRTFF